MNVVRFERDGEVGSIVLSNPPPTGCPGSFADDWPTPFTKPARAPILVVAAVRDVIGFGSPRPTRRN
jgi:hypothetical protein